MKVNFCLSMVTLAFLTASTIAADPRVAHASDRIWSKCGACVAAPVPRLVARSMVSPGILAARAAIVALRNRGFPFGSPPPLFAAIEISLDSLLKIFPRFASIAPLKRLTLDHLLCPAILLRSSSLKLPGQKTVGFGNGRASMRY